MNGWVWSIGGMVLTGEKLNIGGEKLYYFNLPGLQISHISIIQPTPHTRSLTYHPRCIMFQYQNFSFPPSVPFHQRSINIHSTTTHVVQYFSTNSPGFSCQFHSTNTPYSLIQLPPKLYNISSQYLGFPL